MISAATSYPILHEASADDQECANYDVNGSQQSQMTRLQLYSLSRRDRLS